MAEAELAVAHQRSEHVGAEAAALRDQGDRAGAQRLGERPAVGAPCRS